MVEANPLHFTEKDFYNRLSMFATEETVMRHMPRAKRTEFTGLCLRCNKPCAPFSTCKDCRDLATVGRVLRDEIAAGRIVEVGREGRKKVYETTPEGKKHYAFLALERKKEAMRSKDFQKNNDSRKKAKLARKARRNNR